MKLRVSLALLVAPLGAVTILAGCNAVLGIDEASVDPTLKDGAAVDAAPATSDAGSDADAGGTSCAIYCDLLDTACRAENKQYIDKANCLRMCGGYPAAAAVKGNTLGCRQFSAKEAAKEDLAGNCLSAGPFGGTSCAPVPDGGVQGCAAFCTLTLKLCGAGATGYADVAACLTACQKMPFLNGGKLYGPSGAALDPSRDTLDCRMTHLQIAFSDDDPNTKTTHCGHTGVVSTQCKAPVDAGKD